MVFIDTALTGKNFLQEALESMFLQVS